MRKVLPLATIAFLTASAAFAQVEPRMTGEWHSGESDQSLHIQPDGRYQTKVNGKVVDSGRLTAVNGNWKLKSDSGRADTGTVSFISGNMTLHGGMSGSWSHSSSTSNGSAPKSSPPSYHPASSSAPTYSPSYQPPAPASNTSSASGAPSTSPWSYMGNPSSNSNANNAPPNANPSAPTQGLQTTVSQFGPEHRNVVHPGYASADAPPGAPTGAPRKRSWKTMAQYAADHVDGLANKADQLMGQPPPSSQSYSSMYGNTQPADPNPPGLPRPKPWISNYWKNMAAQNGAPIINADEENAKVARARAAGTIQPNTRSQDFDYWAKVQQLKRPSSPGWQVVPQGGYIPVMKDNKARKYWGH